MSSLLKDFPEMYIDLRLAVKKRFISRSWIWAKQMVKKIKQKWKRNLWLKK
jgi:hypothetical protein